MNGVEGFSLLTRHLDSLLRNDAQTCAFNQRIDLAGQITFRRIGFDNRKSAFDRHSSASPYLLE